MVSTLAMIKRDQMLSQNQTKKTFAHLMALIIGVSLTVLSEQNPRVLLYAQAISLLYRFISIWLFAVYCEAHESPQGLVVRLSRKPDPGERSRPYRDQRTGDPAGISTYLVVILTTVFMLTVLFQMTGGKGFLDPEGWIQELSWAASIAFVYWIDDLLNRQFVLAPGKSRTTNLGYNVAGLNFLLLAIFASALLILIIQVIVGMFLTDWPVHLTAALTWAVFLALVLIRFVADAFNLVNRKARLR